MSTIAQRLPADKPGPAIVSSVLTTAEAQLERGTYEVNNQMDDRVIKSGSVVGATYFQPGEMASVDDMGVMKNGLVSKCSGHIRVNSRNVSINTEVTVETIK